MPRNAATAAMLRGRPDPVCVVRRAAGSSPGSCGRSDCAAIRGAAVSVSTSALARRISSSTWVRTCWAARNVQLSWAPSARNLDSSRQCWHWQPMPLGRVQSRGASNVSAIRASRCVIAAACRASKAGPLRRRAWIKRLTAGTRTRSGPKWAGHARMWRLARSASSPSTRSITVVRSTTNAASGLAPLGRPH